MCAKWAVIRFFSACVLHGDWTGRRLRKNSGNRGGFHGRRPFHSGPEYAVEGSGLDNSEGIMAIAMGGKSKLGGCTDCSRALRPILRMRRWGLAETEAPRAQIAVVSGGGGGCEFPRVLPAHSGFCWVLPGDSGFCWVLPGDSGFFQVPSPGLGSVLN
jgi:hypothetical protein